MAVNSSRTSGSAAIVSTWASGLPRSMASTSSTVRRSSGSRPPTSDQPDPATAAATTATANNGAPTATVRRRIAASVRAERWLDRGRARVWATTTTPTAPSETSTARIDGTRPPAPSSIGTAAATARGSTGANG